MANRTVSVSLRAEVSGYMAGIKSAGKATRQLYDDIDGLGKKSPKRFNDIEKALAGMGLALVGVAAYAVKAAAEFDKQMSEVGAVSNATGKELGSLRQAALQAGKDTMFSATEAAKAEAELAKAGLKTGDILGGALDGALSLAAAGQMDLADAATIAAQSLNMFELRGSATTHVADVLAAAANTSAADMHGLGLGLQQVGLVAHQVGFTLEETVGLLAAFADRGLQGSDGATSLKTAIQRLIAPTGEAAKLMEQLGIKVYDSNGRMRHADEIAGSLQTSLSGLSEAQRNAALYTLFGSDAIRAANILYGLGADGVRRYTQAVDQSGAAADVARKKTDNLAGDLERLRGSIETLAIEGGSGANGGLRILVQTVDHLVGGFASLPSGVQGTAVVLAALGGASLLAVAGLLKVRQTAHDALDALREMGPAGKNAAGTLEKIGGIAGKATAVGTAVFLVYEGFAALGHWLDARAAPVAVDVDRMTVALKDFAISGKVAGELAKHFGTDLDKMATDLVRIQVGQEKIAAAQGKPKFRSVGRAGAIKVEPQNFPQRQAVEQAKKDFEGLDEALANLIKNGQASIAAAALDQIAAKTGLSIDTLREKLPKYSDAAREAANANSSLALGMGSVDANAKLMNRGLQDAIEHGQTLSDVFDQLNGAALGWAHAEDNLWQSFDTATEAIKENGRTAIDNGTALDVHTAKGRANQEALLGIAEKTKEAYEARYTDTQSLEEASKVYDIGRQKFIAAAIAMGMDAKAAENLANQWLKMPPVVSTNVQAPGLTAAEINASRLDKVYDQLDGRVVTTRVSTVYTISGHRPNETYSQNRWGGAYEHAARGLVNAGVYTARAPARYAYAEPSTGGEAFIPKYGNMARSRAIADHVVTNWLGGRTSWGGAQFGGAVPVSVDITVRDDQGRLFQVIREEVRGGGGGNVQRAFGRTN